MRSNNDTVFFQKNDYYYFEFKESISKNDQDSIVQLLNSNVDTLEYFENGYGKIYIENDSLLNIFDSFSGFFKYSSPELYIIGDSSTYYYTDNSILAKVKSNFVIKNILDQYSIRYKKIEKINVVDGLYYIELEDNSDIFNIVHILFDSGKFKYVEPSFYFNGEFTVFENVNDYTNNPDFSDQWWLQDNHEANIYIQDAWNLTAGNSKIKIGVLDTGVDFMLNDLRNNCDKGISVVSENFYPQLHGFGSPDTACKTSKVHGTFIASILVAENNDVNLLGVAYNSKVYPIRISRSQMVSIVINPYDMLPRPPGEDIIVSWIAAYLNDYWILQGINHAFLKNLDIINCSFSIPRASEALIDAINSISENGRNGFGTVVVFSSGNYSLDSIHSELAALESVICVGGVDKCGYRCERDSLCNGDTVGTGSNYGNALDVVAPADRFIGLSGGSNNTHGFFSGTSFAAPIVAGIASLILDVNPCLTSAEVREIIEKTARKIHPEHYIYTNTSAHPNGGWNEEVGYGLVNARDAVSMALSYININSGSYYSGKDTIRENTNWDSTLYVTKDIVVEYGAVLNITGKISFAPGTSLTIKYGGKVIINGGELTSLCQDAPWKGVFVEGYENLPQSGESITQGTLILNNSTISNAFCGVMLGNPYYENNPLGNYNYAGGIVIATNSNFINNEIGVKFHPYIYQTGQTVKKNKSVFFNCSFTVNDNFSTSKMKFKSHVELLEVNGITFTGCRFNYDIPSLQSDTCSGIRAFNSGFTVQPKCSSIPFLGEVCDSNKVEIASLFTGLDYGIIALNGDGFYEISILSTNFELNDYGIYLSGINNVRILKNRFIIGKDSNSIVSKPVGLYLQNGSGFRIEENLFRNNTVSNLSKIGLNIKNSGAENNQVYKNQFKNLTYGQIFDGNNCSQRSPATGLVSLCNKNLNNITYDFWVRPIVGCYNGINPYQDAIINTGSGLDTVSAGNQFSSVSSIDIQYNNEGNYLFYKYNPNNTNEILEIYTPTTITRESSSENPCRSKINALYPDIIDAELASITLDYTNLKYNYNQLIDAGNTPEMLQLIQGEWSDDIWNLRVELLGQSPYLSQDAILMVAMENLLPPALLLEVCIANPDATRSEEFLDQLRYKIPTPLPEYMINMIRASWENKTLRTEMEKQLSAFKTYRDEYHNYKTEILLSDTIYNYNNIIDHLESRGSYGDYLSMAEIAISQNNFTQADIYLDILENSTEQLDGEEVKEVASFREYISIRESIALNNKTIYNLDSSQIATLETYAYSNNYRGAILARNILCALYDICIDDIPAPPRSLRVGSNEGNNHNNIPFIASVKVMPNPASEYAAFIWDMKSFDKSSVLYIYDQNGKIIVTQPIHTQQGEWVWNVKNIPDGVYVYTFKSDQLVLFSGKLIISK
ncbi:MAG: S8 family serine peptidase [Bacteroidales bacterium]